MSNGQIFLMKIVSPFTVGLQGESLDRDFRYGPIFALVAASTERTVSSVSSVILSGTLTEAVFVAPRASAAPSS